MALNSSFDSGIQWFIRKWHLMFTRQWHLMVHTTVAFRVFYDSGISCLLRQWHFMVHTTLAFHGFYVRDNGRISWCMVHTSDTYICHDSYDSSISHWYVSVISNSWFMRQCVFMVHMTVAYLMIHTTMPNISSN